MRGPRAPALAAAAAVLALGAAPARAQEMVELSAGRQTDGVTRMEVEVTYGGGELSVRPADPGRLYEYRLRYDASRLRPVRRWHAAGAAGRLEIGVEAADGGEWNVDLGDGDLAELGGLALGLGRDVPTELELEVGAAETSLELGGVALSRLRIRTGASATRLRFGEPNAARMEELDLAAGAASFRAERLGNARFRSLRFKGGIGDVTLDFGGRWEGHATASLSMGVGSLALRFPHDLGVRIRRRTFLTTFDAAGMRRSGDAYVSDNWETAESRLEIDLDATLGTVEVRFGS